MTEKVRWWRPPYMISPVVMRRFNAVSTVFWIVMTPLALVTGWVQSVTFVSVLSIWALVMSSLGAYQAARVEVVQNEADVPADVVQAIVEKTEISERP
jgi:hypothetical protein